MYRIQKSVRFEAAHQLCRFPESHKCHRLHGHNYRVDVVLEAGNVDDRGVVVDYALISDAIRGRYDHQNLNDFPEFSDNPTAELICGAIVDLLGKDVLSKLNANVDPADWVRIVSITVYETDDSWAQWLP